MTETKKKKKKTFWKAFAVPKNLFQFFDLFFVPNHKCQHEAT